MKPYVVAMHTLAILILIGVAVAFLAVFIWVHALILDPDLDGRQDRPLPLVFVYWIAASVGICRLLYKLETL